MYLVSIDLSALSAVPCARSVQRAWWLIHTIRLSGDFLAIDGYLLGDLVAVDLDGKVDFRVLRHSDIGLLHLASCIHKSHFLTLFPHIELELISLH